MFKRVIFILSVLSFLYMSSCDNESDDTQVTNDENTVPDYSAGEDLFLKHCALCHQDNGEGVPGAFPSLKGKEVNLNAVMNGVEGTIMAAYKQSLNDEQIVEIVNYINHSWGNDFNEIDTETIKEMR